MAESIDMRTSIGRWSQNNLDTCTTKFVRIGILDLEVKYAQRRTDRVFAIGGFF